MSSGSEGAQQEKRWDLARGEAESDSEGAGSRTPDPHLQVTFARSGVTARWDRWCTNLLELAEAHGLSPPHGCRQGLCTSCICGLLEGEVEYLDHTVVEPEHGVVLLCSSRPLNDVVIDI